jgi:hypothetical protein
MMILALAQDTTLLDMFLIWLTMLFTSFISKFLHQPHAQAAFMKGRIVWHIAREFLDYDVVLIGPSQSALYGMQAMFDCNGTTFRDDKLGEDEMDLICGVYKVYTGLQTQCSDSSWWPKQSV